MLLIDGKRVAAEVRAGVKRDVERLKRKYGRAPSLAVVLVGDDPASQVYVRNKEKACEDAGITSRTWRLDDKVGQSQLENLILDLDSSDDIDGILLQLPLPDALDSMRCLCLIDPSKDVDGFHPENAGRLSLGLPGFRPCTPAGVMTLLEYYALSPSGKKAVVLGRSNIVGRPMSLMLSASGAFGNATVTVCHSRTHDLPAICREADFLVSAIGKPKFITKDMVKPGAVIIDVGMNRDEKGKLCGDVDFEDVKDVVSAMTPVPGGVGPMTIAMLLVNTANAFRWRMEENEACECDE